MKPWNLLSETVEFLVLARYRNWWLIIVNGSSSPSTFCSLFLIIIIAYDSYSCILSCYNTHFDFSLQFFCSLMVFNPHPLLTQQSTIIIPEKPRNPSIWHRPPRRCLRKGYCWCLRNPAITSWYGKRIPLFTTDFIDPRWLYEISFHHQQYHPHWLSLDGWRVPKENFQPHQEAETEWNYQTLSGCILSICVKEKNFELQTCCIKVFEEECPFVKLGWGRVTLFYFTQTYRIFHNILTWPTWPTPRGEKKTTCFWNVVFRKKGNGLWNNNKLYNIAEARFAQYMKVIPCKAGGQKGNNIQSDSFRDILKRLKR